MLKPPFVLKLFGYIEKWQSKKAKVNFMIYDVTDWTTNNYNIHIAQYFKKRRPSGNEIWSVNRI